MVSMVIFGNIFDFLFPPEDYNESYTQYNNTDIGIRFEYPDFFNPELNTNKLRTNLGSIVYVYDIQAESVYPSSYILIRIIEDPIREELFQTYTLQTKT